MQIRSKIIAKTFVGIFRSAAALHTMSETSVIDEYSNREYDVILPKVDTGLGSIWTGDYVARSKTYNPPLLTAGSTEYNRRAMQGVASERMLNQNDVEALAMSLNDKLIVVGPATDAEAMLKYQNNITHKAPIEHDRTGAMLFDVFAKNWALISREGPGFQLPPEEAESDPVLLEPPADCFNDYCVDERTYIDRACITAWRDRLLEKKQKEKRSGKRNPYFNYSYMRDIRCRPKFQHPPEIAESDTSFTDYTIDERSYIDPPKQLALQASAGIKRKNLLRRWKTVKMRNDEHQWHIEHFQRFLAAHELNASALRALDTGTCIAT